MPRVSVNWLHTHTYKDRRTIERRLRQIQPDAKGKYDSGAAFEAIYLGEKSTNGSNGEFVPTPEAMRRLTIARTKEIDLDMEIKRGDRIPREDCENALNEVLASINGSLKARRNMPLDDSTINEIFGQLRDVGQKMQ